MATAYKYIPPKPPMWFNLAWTGGFGAIVGFLTAQGNTGLMLPYLVIGGIVFAALALVSILALKSKKQASLVSVLVLFAIGYFYAGLSFGVLLALLGYILGRMARWLASGDYRLNLPPLRDHGFGFMVLYIPRHMRTGVSVPDYAHHHRDAA
ncbi:MAG: hypothetical protein GXP03_02650 [Alphaproteobacteria bacterium]|nr:hypothetical protein [Alphaproteobacteria bacterium]